MKKNIIKAVIALVFVVGAIVSFNVDTKANVSPDCPNGCVANGDGCYCNGWYPCLKEYEWKDPAVAL